MQLFYNLVQFESAPLLKLLPPLLLLPFYKEYLLPYVLPLLQILKYSLLLKRIHVFRIHLCYLMVKMLLVRIENTLQRKQLELAQISKLNNCQNLLNARILPTRNINTLQQLIYIPRLQHPNHHLIKCPFKSHSFNSIPLVNILDAPIPLVLILVVQIYNKTKMNVFLIDTLRQLLQQSLNIGIFQGPEQRQEKWFTHFMHNTWDVYIYKISTQNWSRHKAPLRTHIKNRIRHIYSIKHITL